MRYDVQTNETQLTDLPDEHGHFGPYGGIFVAETLMEPLDELRIAYERYLEDPEFLAELDRDLQHAGGSAGRQADDELGVELEIDGIGLFDHRFFRGRLTVLGDLFATTAEQKERGAAATEEQRGQWFLQKYVTQFPTAGEMVLFDRSWYNRAMVEPVFGFCSPKEHEDFLRGHPYQCRRFREEHEAPEEMHWFPAESGHDPPPAAELQSRVDTLCAFANGGGGDGGRGQGVGRRGRGLLQRTSRLVQGPPPCVRQSGPARQRHLVWCLQSARTTGYGLTAPQPVVT